MREEGDAKRQEELQRERQAKQQELKKRRDRAWEGKVKVYLEHMFTMTEKAIANEVYQIQKME